MVQELNAMKQENMQIEQDRGYRNDLLEYLRSLDPDMVTCSGLCFKSFYFEVLVT